MPKPRGSPDIITTLKPLLLVKQGQHRRDRYWQGSVGSAGVLDRGKGTGWVAWKPVMSQVKHKARDNSSPRVLAWSWGTGCIVQRRGRDLKTSVNKLWCAGWIPHFRFFVWGCPRSEIGRRSDDRPHRFPQEFPCRSPALTAARL